mmetsp:Transcript_10477/g.13746  ORF Transcript_10477/g.13746 Transcript_10477/m.13746 type:complete len:86 (-) Transcript_10477:104-361(-)
MSHFLLLTVELATALPPPPSDLFTAISEYSVMIFANVSFFWLQLIKFKLSYESNFLLLTQEHVWNLSDNTGTHFLLDSNTVHFYT